MLACVLSLASVVLAAAAVGVPSASGATPDPRACWNVQPLNEGERLSTYFLEAGPRCFSFEATEGHDIALSLVSRVTAAPGKRLVDGSGRVVCSSGGWAPLRCRIPKTAEYTFQVWDRSERPRGEAIQATWQDLAVTSNCTALPYARTVRARRERTADPLACVVYEKPAVSAVSFERGPGRPKVELLGPDGAATCADTSPPCTLRRGRHVAWVGGSAGTYELRFRVAPPPGCVAGTSEDTLQYGMAPRTLHFRGAEHRCLPVWGVSGHELSLAVGTTSRDAPGKRLLRPDGRELCRSGAWSPLVCEVPATGMYFLETWYRPAPSDSELRAFQPSSQDLNAQSSAERLRPAGMA